MSTGQRAMVKLLKGIKVEKLTFFLSLALFTAVMNGQEQSQPHPESSVVTMEEATHYTLGPNDKILVRTTDVEDAKFEIRIGQDGTITLPQVGSVRCLGLTVDQLRNEIVTRLEKYVKHPQVAVEIVEYHSQPVSVIGAVKTPGVYQVEGRKTLSEMLALAGGTSETAGYSIKITRRPQWGAIPLLSAKNDPTTGCSVAQVDLKVLVEALDPRQDIEVRPDDVISVPRGGLVYVSGEVKKPGGFVLVDRRSISVLQALSLAEGMTPTAVASQVKILRTSEHSEARTEISVDVKKIYEGKSTDVTLQTDDILFVPTSQSKKAWARSVEALIQAATGMAIYRVGIGL